MNLEKFKETIEIEIQSLKSISENSDNYYYDGQIDALQWVLNQFEEEHGLLRNS